MKLTTTIGETKFSFTNNDDLIKQLEAAKANLDEQLKGFDSIRKQRQLIIRTLKQLKGEVKPKSKKTAEAVKSSTIIT
jgi:hypothetical protein